MAIELTAAQPERVIAAVLLSAAAGSDFDRRAQLAVSWPPGALGSLLGALMDTEADRRHTSARDRAAFRRSMFGAFAQSAQHPLHMVQTVRCIAKSDPSPPLLHIMRDNGIPTIVVHGERDRIIPWINAENMAHAAGAALYQVPNAHHSWMIANPSDGADAFAQLMKDELGAAVRGARRRLGIRDDGPQAWEQTCLTPGLLAFDLIS